MMRNPTALIMGLSLAAITLPFNIPAAEDEKPWTIGLSLDSPDLPVPAVQWAIFNEDPVPEFKDRIRRYRGGYEKQIKGSKNERRMREIRSARITVDWDRGFRKVSGDKVYMLTGEPLHSQGYSSDSADGPKWIVTKAVSTGGMPICWCLPVEVHRGETIQLELTEKNRFYLLASYEDVMNEPAPAK